MCCSTTLRKLNVELCNFTARHSMQMWCKIIYLRYLPIYLQGGPKRNIHTYIHIYLFQVTSTHRRKEENEENNEGKKTKRLKLHYRQKCTKTNKTHMNNQRITVHSPLSIKRMPVTQNTLHITSSDTVWFSKFPSLCSPVVAFHWYRNRWPWMTLSGHFALKYVFLWICLSWVCMFCFWTKLMGYN